MTKAELAKRVMDECGVDKETATITVDKVLDTIKDTVVSGEEVFIRGFGTFGVKHRAEKTARNISKGTIIVVPAHDIPSFRPSQCFKDGVARKK